MVKVDIGQISMKICELETNAVSASQLDPKFEQLEKSLHELKLSQSQQDQHLKSIGNLTSLEANFKNLAT